MEKAISVEQIMKMTNQEKRRKFLSGWREWPALVQVPELGLDIREVILPDCNRMTAAYYEGDPLTYHGKGHSHDPLLGIQKPGEDYRPRNMGETHLIRHLTLLRKVLGELPAEETDKMLTLQDDETARAVAPSITVNNELAILSMEDIRKIRNDPSREQFARHAHEVWPLWVEVLSIGMKVFRMGLPNGQILCATTFGDRAKWYNIINKGGLYSSRNCQEYSIVSLLRDLRVQYLSELRAVRTNGVIGKM